MRLVDAVAIWEVAYFPNGNVCFGATSLLWEGPLSGLESQERLGPRPFVDSRSRIHICRKVAGYESSHKYPAEGSDYKKIASFANGEGEPQRYQQFVKELVAGAEKE